MICQSASGKIVSFAWITPFKERRKKLELIGFFRLIMIFFTVFGKNFGWIRFISRASIKKERTYIIDFRKMKYHKRPLWKPLP